MANVIDETIGINIGLIAQGLASLSNTEVYPAQPIANEPFEIRTTVSNVGDLGDTFWCTIYVDGIPNPLGDQLIDAGASYQYRLNYPSGLPAGTTINYHFIAGHYEGDVAVLDDRDPDTGAYTLSIIPGEGQADAYNVNYPTHVEPNIEIIINYEVENTGGVDMLWGELYESGVAVPGTYWEETFTTGQIKSKTMTISGGITEPFVGELRVGHVE